MRKRQDLSSFMGNFSSRVIHILRFFHYLSYKLWGSVGLIAFIANEIQQFFFGTGQLTNPKDLFVVRLIIEHLPISIPVIALIALVWWIGWEAEKEWKRRLNPIWNIRQQQAYLQSITTKYTKIKLVVDFIVTIPLSWQDIIQPLVLRRDPRKRHQVAPDEVGAEEQQGYQEVPSSTSALIALEESRKHLKKANIIVLGDPGSGKTTWHMGQCWKPQNGLSAIPMIAFPSMYRFLN